MSEYDYANARLRAMKSRLLPRPKLAALAEVGSVPGLITALANTPYRQAVEAALARFVAQAVGLECLNAALSTDLVSTLGNARSFFREGGSTNALAALVFRSYDLHNIKTMLRGLARHVPASEILASTLPVGELRPSDLVELARATDPGMAIDLLTTWGGPLARPLLELRARRQIASGELPAMELALDRWHLETALRAARAADEPGQPLYQMLMMQADVTNILTALRWVGLKDTATILREHFGGETIEGLFVGPGYLSFKRLKVAAQCGSVMEAVNTLAERPYGAALAEAATAYSVSGRLSAFERALDLHQLRRAASNLACDALGIGVLLGYVALKTNEISNLRAIANGLALGEQPEHIRAALMIVN
jgi:V/A-type H+-transporting ATPase subunit C